VRAKVGQIADDDRWRSEPSLHDLRHGRHEPFRSLAGVAPADGEDERPVLDGREPVAEELVVVPSAGVKNDDTPPPHRSPPSRIAVEALDASPRV